MAGNYPVGDRIPPSVEEIQQETLDWWHSLEPNEQVRLREKYGEQSAAERMMEEYCGYYQKFLRDLPKELVIDVDCGYDFTWRYVLHNNDVVIYTVTVSYDIREVRTVVKHASIAFFYRNGRPKESGTQRQMSLDVGIEPIYKQISLTSGSKPGWEYDAILKLGCTLGDTF